MLLHEIIAISATAKPLLKFCTSGASTRYGRGGEGRDGERGEEDEIRRKERLHCGLIRIATSAQLLTPVTVNPLNSTPFMHASFQKDS